MARVSIFRANAWRYWAQARWAESCSRLCLRKDLLSPGLTSATVQHEERARL